MKLAQQNSKTDDKNTIWYCFINNREQQTFQETFQVYQGTPVSYKIKMGTNSRCKRPIAIFGDQ